MDIKIDNIKLNLKYIDRDDKYKLAHAGLIGWNEIDNVDISANYIQCNMWSSIGNMRGIYTTVYEISLSETTSIEFESYKVHERLSDVISNEIDKL